MNYNFDEIIDRRNTNSISFESWRNTLGERKNEKFAIPDDEFIRMWVADMDFATPIEIRNAIQKRLDEKILGYSTIFDPEYFNILESWFSTRYHYRVIKEEIVLAPGIVPALNRLVPFLLRENENILINTPSYAPFKNAGDLHDKKVYYSPLKNENGFYSLDVEDIKRQLDDPEKNIQLFIFCNPHNPTGRVWTENELSTIAEICTKRNIWLISDEIHCDLVRCQQTFTSMHRILPKYPQLIVCTAPSKTFNMAGNLHSHVIIKDDVVREKYQKMYFEVYSPLSIAATKAAYQNGELWLEELKRYLDETFLHIQKMISEELPEAVFRIPEATYLGWIDFSAYHDIFEASETLTYFFAKNAGVIVEGGEAFVDNAQFHIRINIASPRSVVINGMQKIIAAIRNKQENKNI